MPYLRIDTKEGLDGRTSALYTLCKDGMMLTEWRRRRIIREEYQRLLEEGFRAEVRRQIQEQCLDGAVYGNMNGKRRLHIMVLAMMPVLIVVSEGMLLLK